MKIGRHSLSAVLLTLAFVAAALVLGSAGQAARATVPAPQAAQAPVQAQVLPGQAAAQARSADDTTPPTRPTGLRHCPVPLAPTYQPGYASICWYASSDGSGIAGYDLYRLDVEGFVKAATTTSTVGGFSGELNRMYTIYVVARDTAGNVSAPSELITVPAVTGMTPSPSPSPTAFPDNQPPSRPAGLSDGCLADFAGVSFCWQPSTDNIGVVAYDIYRETATAYLKVGTRQTAPFLHFTETGLETGKRYNYFVVARDVANNISLPSAILSALAREGMPSPSPSPTGSCTVTYRATTWNTGLNAEITIRNTGATAIDGWTLTLEYASPAPRLASGWSATWTQDGARISGTHQQWNKTIPAGTSTQVGFTATHGGTAAAPAKVALNGATCVTG
ncbi:cellulose binding domain-containing protein [Sphaerisporangium siamense]|uniref:Cellulose 1,4-beta-cellobiosidase n=1 Tax=Sphaerisporangium siamense TaxID=795645 RepID=A0A7W7G9E8_9ACTN|nr:cellulose binding domain-containing protein [Sphaerisporangium siamense]MBB4700464.1 cellulose 1,4-beta-cellobiosidase [Sphaerisporangium siamense]